LFNPLHCSISSPQNRATSILPSSILKSSASSLISDWRNSSPQTPTHLATHALFPIAGEKVIFQMASTAAIIELCTSSQQSVLGLPQLPNPCNIVFSPIPCLFCPTNEIPPSVQQRSCTAQACNVPSDDLIL